MYYFIGGRNAKSGKGLGVLRYSPGFPIKETAMEYPNNLSLNSF